jgi:hypothetical protein
MAADASTIYLVRRKFLARDRQDPEGTRAQISRMACRNSVTHKFVKALEQHAVSLARTPQGIETLPKGRRNPGRRLVLALPRWRAANTSC